MLQKLNALTSFKGCMNRTDYWFYIFMSLVITSFGEIVLIALVTLLNPQPEYSAVTITLLVVRGAFVVAALIVYFSAVVRRLHDINMTGYLALLFIAAGLFTPLLLVMMIVLGCVPTRVQNNRFKAVS